MVTENKTDTLLQIITRLLAELHQGVSFHREITLDSYLDKDLGLDSLGRMELLSRLEKEFGVRLPEHVLVAAETPRDLLRHLAASPVASEDTSPHDLDKPGWGDRSRAGFHRAATLLEVLDMHVQQQADTEHILLLNGGEEISISYGDLQVKAMMVAACLRRLGLEPGNPVAIMLPTNTHYFYCFFGVLLGGGVPVPLYPPARPTQIEEHVRRHRKIIGNAAASILITVPAVKPVGRLLKSQVPELKEIITVDELYVHDEDNISVPAHAGDTAFLQYTSGSTGDPKGVALSHANLLANIKAMGQVCQVTAEDVFISWLPLYHDMGLIGAWLGSLCYGCRLVVMPPLSFLARPERWLKAISRFQGTLSASPNFGYELCCTRIDDKDLEGLDLSSWRMALNGAEPVIPETMTRFLSRFQSYGLKASALAPVYGLAESSVGLTFPLPDTGLRVDKVDRDTFVKTGKAIPVDREDSSCLVFVCCGLPLPGHQVRVVDEQHREVPERQQGRLQFKGPSATGGYYRNNVETRKLFVGEWLDSGDLAYFANGEIYITSRQKDIIIRGGRNVYPHELEEVIGNIEGIRKGCTAVVGSKDQKSGTERMVVLAETRRTKEEELALLRRQVNMVIVDLIGIPPDDVVLLLPGAVLKTSSGKIRRSACRDLYENGQLGRKKSAVWLQLLRMVLKSLGPLLRRAKNRVFAMIYSCYCWLIFGVTAAMIWPFLLIIPEEKSWKLARNAARLLGGLAGIRVRVAGLENLPLGKQYLMVSNHMSYLDSMVLTGILPEQCNFVAKAELEESVFLRQVLKKLGVLYVNRFDVSQGLEDTRNIAESIRDGARPLFFGEGTLQRMPGLLPFQMGAFLLACQEQVPVVPIVIRGTRSILRGGSWFPRFGSIEVAIGPLCQPGGDDWHSAIKLRERVRGEILSRLREPDLKGEYTSLHQMDIEKPTADDI